MLLYFFFSRCQPWFLLGLLFSCSWSLSAGTKPIVPEQIPGSNTLTAEQVIEMILSRPDLVVIDSRKKTEYVKGHIEGAINMLNTRMTRTMLETAVPNKTATILFYCNGARCLRSSDAVNKALSWGYENIYWFRGGIEAWKAGSYPIQK